MQFQNRKSSCLKLIKSMALIFIVLGLSLSMSACEDDDGASAPEDEMTAQDFVDRGWDRFESDNYTAALDDFKGALNMDSRHADALNGAGWASGRLNGQLTQAYNYFRDCLSIDTLRWDGLGGWAFVCYQRELWQEALDKANSLLNSKPRWRFLHESEIDFIDLRLMTSAAYFNLGQYSESYMIIKTYLNPSFETDIDTQSGRRELLEEIERLRLLHG